MSTPANKHQAPWPDLASERLGGRVLATNDDFFAAKENLIKESAPVWDAERYTDRGKWMDGWESRRRREPGHDWCLVRLGSPGRPVQVVIDTAFFTGNYPEKASLEALDADWEATVEELENSQDWAEILPPSDLAGDHEHVFDIEPQLRATHLRLRIYPDGGVARLRVFAEALPDLESLSGAARDLASAPWGGRILAASDRFYSAPEKLLLPDEPRGMFDGWETKRRRDDGNDWVVVGLAAAAKLERVVIDTRHFKGNAPGWCSVETASSPDGRLEAAGLLDGELDAGHEDLDWQPLLARSPVEPHAVHTFDTVLREAPAADLVRLQIYPDGGVARLRLFGTMDKATRQALGLRRLALESAPVLRRRLLACCAAERWANAVAERRPFGSADELLDFALESWRALSTEDHLEAFGAHPRIGGSAASGGGGAVSARWSSDEQSGVEQAAADTLERLAAANREYFDTFGFVFLISAAGKSAAEMLAALEKRLHNDREQELAHAADEQAKITRLRLERLLTS